MTHTGLTYYLSAPSQQERNEWIVHVKRALECNFANPGIVPFKPSKFIQSRPPRSASTICVRTKQQLNSGSALYCKSCGRGYSSSEFVQDVSTMLQIGQEDSDRCCLDCKNAQIVIIWLKSLNYIHAMNLHELSPIVLEDLTKFKATFKLQRRQYERLDMAAQLLDTNDIDATEFRELCKVNQEARREHYYEESRQLKQGIFIFFTSSFLAQFNVSHLCLQNKKLRFAPTPPFNHSLFIVYNYRRIVFPYYFILYVTPALEAIGEDMQMIIGLLMNSKATEKGGRASYFQVIIKILQIADRDPELLDFYLPQILQAHLLEASVRTGDG